jgi:hypothetical protein
MEVLNWCLKARKKIFKVVFNNLLSAKEFDQSKKTMPLVEDNKK